MGKWRSRFIADRLEGLTDEDRPGRPRTITDEKVEEVIVTTLERPPGEQQQSLVHPVDGEGNGHEPDRGVADLAGL